MGRSACCLMAVCMLVWPLPALFALDAPAATAAARAEICSFLAEKIASILKAGEQPKAWVVVFGKKMEAPVIESNEKTLTVLLQKNPFPMLWEKIEPVDLLAIAKSVANGKAERLLVAAEVAAGLEKLDDALQLLGLAREADPSLAPKIKALAEQLVPARAAPPAKAAPAAPGSKTSSPATPTAGGASGSKNPATGAAALPASLPITGPVLLVGPSRPYKTLASAAARVNPGEMIVIDPGTYNEALKLSKKGTLAAPIRLVGLPGAKGERPVLDGTGVSVSGVRSTPRALLQVEGEHYHIENLELKNARNGDNGAGIRLLNSRQTIVRNCKITYCDMGIQGGDLETLLVERSEIAFNGTKDYDGYSHNFYLGGNRAVIRNCHIHSSLFGQNFKTRGHYTELWYNWIADSEEGEIGPVDGKETAEPNSNFLMVGNVVVSKPDRKGNTSKYIDFGKDGSGGAQHDGTIFIFNNTFIAGSPKVTFLTLSTSQAKGVLANNIFVGSDRLIGQHGAGLKGWNNWVQPSANVPPELRNCFKGTEPGFLDRAKRDFHLLPGSPCRDKGADPKDFTYLDGDGKSLLALPARQLIFPLKDEPRPKRGPLDLGAFE